MKILVTGAAGFIGMHVVQAFVRLGYEVVGLDNLNAYYDTSLKYARLQMLGIPRDQVHYSQTQSGMPGFRFVEMDLQDADKLHALFDRERFDRVVHLAAQAGVRHSITNPRDYIDANITGMFHVLEACRHFPVSHLVFASSSSVYGLQTKAPFAETDPTDAPISLYAASKKSNELMAYAYAQLYDIPCTGLRFFTVYGPWGRPDMAIYLFAKAMMEQKPIRLFNYGNLQRDFTYIDDIVTGVVRIADTPPTAISPAYRLFNIGRGQPVLLLDMVAALERAMGLKALIDLQPMQPGDVYMTYADTRALEAAIGYKPQIDLEEGIQRYIAWFKAYEGWGGSAKPVTETSAG